MSTYSWKHLSKISIDVFVHGCEIPRVAAIGITPVEEDKCCLWVRLDDRLHVGWRGKREGDIRIAKTSMELDWMKVLPQSAVV